MAKTIGRTLAAIALLAIVSPAIASDVVTIKIPKHSELTPVQRLNREGVAAIKKNQFAQATKLFYKAYLYDPSDPFTLNNLGYISELQGDSERAHKFYALATEQSCDAAIDMSNVKELEGKPMQLALQGLPDTPMRANRINVDAMVLLKESRAKEAVVLLRQALAADPGNPFTLNNLGVAYEAIGDTDEALKFYVAAAETHSTEPVVITLDGAWSGRSISSMAAAGADRLQARMGEFGSARERAVVLSSRGVSATNENNMREAKADFLNAYSLDPNSAFSLNNRGFVAEMDHDLESAQFFYDKARRAADSGALVGRATQHGAEGKRLLDVAAGSQYLIDDELEKYSRDRRREAGPIDLVPRGGNSDAPVEKPSTSTVPSSAAPAPQQPR